MTLASAQLADNPTALWKLDETSGTTAVDATGNGHGGTYQRPAMVGATSWGGTPSPSFTHTSTDWISVPASSALSSHAGPTGLWSMDCMFLDGGVADYQMILTVSDFPNGYEMWVERNPSGYLAAGACSKEGSGYVPNVADVTLGNTVSTSTWHHLAITWSRSVPRLNIYVDGCLAAQSLTSTANTSSFTNKIWRIGGRGDTTANRWSGSLSHMAIYPSELSPERVREHAIAAGITPPCVAFPPPGGWSVGMIQW